MALTLPQNLVDSVRDDDDDRRRGWVARLPETVRDLAQRWSLEVGEPYQPGGQCAWVAPAVTSAGSDVVLKVQWRHAEAEDEADGLRAWDGHGAIVVYDALVAPQTRALLLERCDPGTTLAVVQAEAEQDLVIAGLLRRLWAVPADKSSFRPLQAMCDAWAAGLEARLDAHPGRLDPGLTRAGIELWHELPATAAADRLLVTDLHAGNVLASQREPWLAIDPKPFVGDPAFDALQHMLNCDRLLAAPVALADRMAGLLDLDAARMRDWLFARCVQGSLDRPELARVAVALRPA